MTRKEAKKMLPILVAFAEGKAIESRCVKGDKSLWYDDEDPSFDDDFEYRIKPESEYRPFKDAEECWAEMLKHEPFGWVKTKDKGIRLCMSGLNQKSAFTQVGHKYDEAFDEFTFADGTPFGVKVEE
jgi:hypothetical protein